MSYAGLEPCQVVPDAVFELFIRVGRPVYRLSYLDRPWPVSTIRHPPRESTMYARLAGPIIHDPFARLAGPFHPFGA